MKRIRLSKKDLDLDIYRIYPMHRFLELLDIEKLTLVRPKLWHDPMESIIFESSFNRAGETSYSLEYKDNYFAQCWTLKYESFALWKEYAPLQNGIRVRTKLRTLIDQLSQHSNQQTDTWFIGKIDYMSIDRIRQWLGENLLYIKRVSMPSVPYGQVHPLFIKLNQYSNEREVRIVFHSNGDQDINSQDIYQDVPIEPLTLFDRLMFDPRMPENICEVFRAELVKRGFRPKQIMRSDLLNDQRLRKKLQLI